MYNLQTVFPPILTVAHVARDRYNDRWRLTDCNWTSLSLVYHETIEDKSLDVGFNFILDWNVRKDELFVDMKQI